MRSSGSGGQLPSLGDVTDAEWVALSRRRIFFGHQSVGNNIMAGVESLLAANPRIGLTVVQSKNLDSTQAPAFRHDAIGRNYFPLEKLDEFVQVADRLGGDGVAMVKLCFVDVEPTTDPRALFEEYRRRMSVVRERHPGLTIIHFTMPLTVVENWKGRLAATVLRRPTERARNVVRNRYNALLLEAYQGKEPIFDIARLESTLPDGGRVYIRSGADTVYVMNPAYSDDGAHLNAAARRQVAEQLLIKLAQLPGAPVARPRD